ncbi:hypothetical protein [Nocardia callitridis]|uniref:Uncharacterized protein n=1 Tax=Nocardia callitridis TaxID=648753 RepID=A0ABP9JVK2_9NOCA
MPREPGHQDHRDISASPLDKPVLARPLTRCAKDKAHHFSLLADVVGRSLRVGGDTAVEPIRDAIANFRMPLSDTVRGYRLGTITKITRTTRRRSLMDSAPESC